MKNDKNRYLVLADGSVFAGKAFGADTDSMGELVFTTGVGGYIETITDPGSWGQIVLHTFPMIGNYGMIGADIQGECGIRGYVVREWCDTPSNFRSEGNLDDYLRQQGVPGIYGVDTRELTRILRERGVMNAMLCDTVPADLTALREYAAGDAIRAVTVKETVRKEAVGEEKFRVTLLDLGAKKSIADQLCQRGCRVTAVNAFTSAGEILADQPDGVVLAGGPGNPGDYPEISEEIGKLLGKVPMLAIDMGHLLLGISQGGRAVKMKHGHHGGNQPVRNTASGRIYVTGQSHGYVLENDAASGQISYVNVNDGSIEGMEYPRAISVQFHPEACSGPRDTTFIFDDFCCLMGGNG